MVRLRDGQHFYESPFFDPAFARLLAGIRADTHLITARDKAGLAAFWPLHVRPGRWARPIGAAFSDWHGPVLRPDMISLSPESLLKEAGLSGMTAPGLCPSALHARSGGQIQAAGIATLPEGADGYRALMKKLHAKHYKNLRRAERLIAKDFDEMSIVIDDHSIEAFEWLMSTKQDQYIRTGRHNVLGPEWVQTMMKGLFALKEPGLRGRLSTLRLDGKLAAAEFNLLSEKIVHGWITVYDQACASYSVGHLLMLSIICDIENTGHEACDIGVGDHDYKKYYESYVRPVESAVIRTGAALRPLAGAWNMTETIMPGRLKRLMGSMRRRGDQIFNTELESKGRLQGLKQALLKNR